MIFEDWKEEVSDILERHEGGGTVSNQKIKALIERLLAEQKIKIKEVK